MGVLLAIVILGLLVLVHEAGHFFMARLAGVRVLRFSIGFGPKIYGWRRGSTDYWISWIPFGGYVKMAGEQHAERSAKPWEFLSKAVGIRALIVFAGPFVNYLAALAMFWIFLVVGLGGLLPVVGEVVKDMPAQGAGFQAGDRILRIDGEPVRTWSEMSAKIYQAPEEPLQVEIRRAGELRTLAVTPVAEEVTGSKGESETIGLIGISYGAIRAGPLEGLWESFVILSHLTGQTFKGLWQVVTGQVPARDSVAGPIRIVVWTSKVASTGLEQLLIFVGFISLSLAIVNLFPIPVLDGGHLLFLALEKLRGRPVSALVQERASQVGLVVLAALVVLVCINDLNWFRSVD